MVTQRSRQILGVILLIIVNIVWVGTSELASHLFNDLGFKRPIFYTYFKLSMLALFMFRCGHQKECDKDEPNGSPEVISKSFYNKLQTEDDEDTEFEPEDLTNAEFEPIVLDTESTASEDVAKLIVEEELTNKVDNTPRKKRHVRFSMMREVRRLPERISMDAKLARLPYRPRVFDCSDICSGKGKYALWFSYTFYFAPLWIITSVTYHAALAYASVSLVNLISSSSSLFVLVLGALFGRQSADKFTFTKLILVVLNLVGVIIVSHFTGSWAGTTLSLLSSVVNALWLVVFSNVSAHLGHVDMYLLLGITGIFTFVVCTPAMIFIHISGIESQLPIPNQLQMFIVILNGFVGTLLGDFMWLYATLLTSSLISTLSMTLSIPFSMAADAFFRNQPPDAAQIFASIPILVSFIGASFLTSSYQTHEFFNQQDQKDSAKSSKDNGVMSFTNNRRCSFSDVEGDHLLI